MSSNAALEHVWHDVQTSDGLTATDILVTGDLVQQPLNIETETTSSKSPGLLSNPFGPGAHIMMQSRLSCAWAFGIYVLVDDRNKDAHHRISCTAPPKAAPKPSAPVPPSPLLAALFTFELSQPSSSRPKEGMAAIF
ncbi:hypothetical protein Tco_1354300 [Tanacetum coccineum]